MGNPAVGDMRLTSADALPLPASEVVTLRSAGVSSLEMHRHCAFWLERNTNGRGGGGRIKHSGTSAKTIFKRTRSTLALLILPFLAKQNRTKQRIVHRFYCGTWARASALNKVGR